MRSAERLGVLEKATADGRAARSARRRRRLLTALLALVLGGGLALLLAQLFLPGIAAQMIREEVARYGTVASVSVHASPAIELLWRSAERVDVHAVSLRTTPSDLAGLERKLGGVENAEVTVATLELPFLSTVTGSIVVHDVRLTKHGQSLLAKGSLSMEDVRLSLPAGLRLEGIASAGGQPEVTLGGELLGARISGRALMTAQNGNLVAEPVGLPLVGLARLTLFSSPAIYVEAVEATPQGEGFAVSMRARARN